MRVKWFFVALVVLIAGPFGETTSLNMQTQLAFNFVTETSEAIIVENAYYKAVFDRDPDNAHGRIREFYIKPETTVNVIPTFIWKMFAGHEILTANGTVETDPRDWALNNCENVSTMVVYNSEGVAVVKTDKWWRTYAEGYYQAHIISYWIFYQDKPYYLEHHKRVYCEDFSFIFNSETCYFFNEHWVSNHTCLNEDGTILQGTNPKEFIEVEEAKRLGKYPWVYLYNTTYNLGVGMILLSANPTTTCLWPYYHAPGNYIEAQVQYGIEAVKAGQTAYHTLLTYVTRDHNDVDRMAADLCSDFETIESFLISVQVNQNKPALGYMRGDFSVLPNRIHLEAYSDHIISRWYYRDRGSYAYVKYENGTGVYDLYDWESLSWRDWRWNGSYGTVTLQNDFQGKIRLQWKYEFWNNSDCLKQTLNFTVLATCNISSLYVNYHKVMPSTHIQRLNENAIKIFDYDSYYEPWVEEVGATYQSLTGCAANEALAYDANFYVLNQTETEATTGASYEMEIKEQPYYRLKTESLGPFTQSDILDFGESENSRFHVVRWNKFPLDSNSNLAIKHYGLGYMVAPISYEATRLRFLIAGENETSAIQIYSPKGQPIEVLGADSWNYDNTTKVLSVAVSHTSPKLVEIEWLAGDINGDGKVDVSDLVCFNTAYSSTPSCPNWNCDCDCNGDCTVDALDLVDLSKNYGKTV